MDWAGRLSFSSFLPTGLPERAARHLDELKPALAPLDRLQWLTSSSGAPGEAQRRSRCCRADGGDLAKVLRDDQRVLDATSDWLQRCPDLGESVSVARDTRGSWAFNLRRGGAESLPLHLAGEGIRWLLPVALATFWAEERRRDSPTLLAIEEPECRLHPSLHISLFERLLGLLQCGVPSVLETHSVYVLRCMQRAVARGELSPDDVALYWVERGPDRHAARLRRIVVEADGRLKDWHADTFEEEQALSRQIFQARWRRATPP